MPKLSKKKNEKDKQTKMGVEVQPKLAEVGGWLDRAVAELDKVGYFFDDLGIEMTDLNQAYERIEDVQATIEMLQDRAA